MPGRSSRRTRARPIDNGSLREASADASQSRSARKHAQHAAASAGGFHFAVDAAAESERADAIAGGRGHPREQRARARGLHVLEAHARSEAHARVLVHDEQEALLAFFLEDFRVRLAAARGDAPVHVADLVAREIDTRLAEIDAASAPARGMSTRAQRRAASAAREARAVRDGAEREQLVEGDVGWIGADRRHVVKGCGYEMKRRYEPFVLRYRSTDGARGAGLRGSPFDTSGRTVRMTLARIDAEMSCVVLTATARVRAASKSRDPN